MALIKRVLNIEPEGPDTIVTLSFSGAGFKDSVKVTARGRAIAEAGINVPKSLRERTNITKVEDFDYYSEGFGRMSGTITVRVRNSR